MGKRNNGMTDEFMLGNGPPARAMSPWLACGAVGVLLWIPIVVKLASDHSLGCGTRGCRDNYSANLAKHLGQTLQGLFFGLLFCPSGPTCVAQARQLLTRSRIPPNLI